MNLQATIPATRPAQALEVQTDGPIGWLRNEIDRLFDDFPFSRLGRSVFPLAGLPAETKPALEIREKDDGYCLTLEVPGIDEKDLDVEVAEGVLTISGEKRAERESKESGYLISERSYGAFRRQVKLPADVDADSLEAKVRNGVLRLNMRKDKSAASQARKIAIG